MSERPQRTVPRKNYELKVSGKDQTDAIASTTTQVVNVVIPRNEAADGEDDMDERSESESGSESESDLENDSESDVPSSGSAETLKEVSASPPTASAPSVNKTSTLDAFFTAKDQSSKKGGKAVEVIKRSQ